MDFNNIFKPDETLPEAVADVERWLKEMERRGLTVTDLNKRIQIMQTVSTKLSNTAKIETGNLVTAGRLKPNSSTTVVGDFSSFSH